MEITADMPEDFRSRHRIVRLDLFTELPGLIICASESTGVVLMQVREKSQTDLGQEEFVLGARGLRIMPR